MHRASVQPNDLVREMVEAFAINDRMNQLVLKHLDPRAWQAKPLGKGTRTIAAVFTHVHNVRCKWLRLSAPHLGVPPQLHRSKCTQKQAASALSESAALCCEMLREAIEPDSVRVHSFVRDAWFKPWKPGATMFAYMITHEAHHRGQACMLAHQLGFPLPASAGQAMWVWEKSGVQRGSAASSVRSKG